MIEKFGWDSAREGAFVPLRARGLVPARVSAQHRGRFVLVTAEGECTATLAGRFAFDAAPGDYPVTGDWTAVTPAHEGEAAIIHAVLPRGTLFVRKAVGGKGGQAVAANVDIALLAMSANADFNLRRLERYMAATLQSGARPIVVLTKIDICPDPSPLVAQCRTLSVDVDVLPVSVVTGYGLRALAEHLGYARTAVLLGSSGVGKSSLVNALAGRSVMATSAVRESDDRGRHTTTHRELIELPSGAILLDTPGMRELGLWEAEAGFARTFADIEDISLRCRFRDCRHDQEPACAVREALDNGAIDQARWRSYRKLQREAGRTEAPRERHTARKAAPHRRHSDQEQGE